MNELLAAIEISNVPLQPIVQISEVEPGRVVEVAVPISGATLTAARQAAEEAVAGVGEGAIATVRGGADTRHDTLAKLAAIIAALGVTDIVGLADALSARASLVGGKVPAAQIPALNAALIGSGTIDLARLPIIPSQRQVVSSGDLLALTNEQISAIGMGTLVTIQDGTRYVYAGEGSKTDAGSYVVLADVTPEWSVVANKPSAFPPTAHGHAIGDVSGLQLALDGKQASDATLTALAGLTTVADRLIYATGADAFALATLTAYARSLLAAADAPALKTLLSLAKADVGLGNVDNTSDAAKPVSLAQGMAIAARLAAASNLSDLSDAKAARANLGLEKVTPRGDAAYTILATDRVVALTAALTAPRTWTLPAANSVNPGQPIRILDVAGGISATNTLTLAPAGTDTLNGLAAGIALAAPYGSFEFISDGASKWTVSSRAAEGGRWKAFSPAPRAQTPGATPPTFGTVTGAYELVGKRCQVRLYIEIGSAGTGAGSIIATLPFASAVGVPQSGMTGRENALNGKGLCTTVGSNSTALIIQYAADGGYPGQSGAILVVGGAYEIT